MEFKKFVENHFDTSHKVGDDVWICDFRHENALEKPIRHIKPQRVQIEDNANLPARKTIYYAPFHFRPYGTSGIVKKQVIAPYDNTGFRGYTGIGVQVFFTEQDCRDFYNEQCSVVKKQLEEARKTYNAILDRRLEDLAQEIADNV